ncbi:MAG: hypothetical protein QM503_11890 [Bacteroidota bacterium]
MDFKKAAILSNYISRDYAETIFKLLMNYTDISASEAASRLNMHIRPIQEFLEAMVLFEIVEKKEVYERKRPYNRYSLKKKKIELLIDLEDVFKKDENHEVNFKIREIQNSIAKFSIARNGEYFSTVSIWTGNGREGKEHKISLTISQGKFLYYLPFPDADPLTVDEIINKADINILNKPEILDIIEELFERKIVEKID